MLQHRQVALVSFAAAVVVVVGGAGRAVAQPRPDLGAGATGRAWPKACAVDVLKAAQWFVRELDDGKVTVESGPGWLAWRGTTNDDGQLLPVLWLEIEEIDPASRSAGAVSGWIEVQGPPRGMQTAKLDEDTSAAVLPDSHFARSLGRWRLTRSLVDGTPKEDAIVGKALDRCAAALMAPPAKKKPARKR